MTSVSRNVAAASLLVVFMGVAQPRIATAEPEEFVHFDIPSQPLASALRAYSKATGYDVFNDGALSRNQQATALTGLYAPMAGLRVLLRGTGYVPRVTDMAHTVTIVPAPSLAPHRTIVERYQPYFALLQIRLDEAFCGEAPAAGEAVTVRFWLDPFGSISKVELAEAGSRESQRDVVARLQGLQTGKTPPAGLPAPLTMVIYPPQPGVARQCSAGAH